MTSAKAQTFCGPANPVANPNIMGGVMCQQAYALCIAAPCILTSKHKPTGKEGETFTIGGGVDAPGGGVATLGDIIHYADCSCDVIVGNSIGQAVCNKRAQHGDRIISTYSFQQNPDPLTAPQNDLFRVLTCPAGLQYADCYNQPCKIDPMDPNFATCDCPVFTAKDTYITRGGECKSIACNEIFSAAPSLIFPLTNDAMACGIGLPAPPPEFACPFPP